jgi:hypothetical protein
VKRPSGDRLGTAIGAATILLAGPATVVAHSVNSTYQSRLPLAVYLAGAALTVALSFAFLMLADVRAEPPSTSDDGKLPPAWLRTMLRAVGLIGWSWVVIQGIAGGASSGDVATLFLWIYGWVGVAAISALVGPIWHWLDPFATLFDIGAAIARRLDLNSWEPAAYPTRLGRWPAVIGLVFFVWLELVVKGGPSSLFIVLVGYTAFSLAMMAQFGRNTWRRNGETFSVWFGLLNRLALYGLGDDEGRIRRRPFAMGLLEPGWTTPDIVLVAIGVGSILYDGLSQTTPWFSIFGAPAVPIETLQLAGFLGVITVAALTVARLVGVAATGAGLLPIAVGYLIAHYFTYLFIDGQRILVAIADPLQQGWDLGGFGWAFFQPDYAFLPPGLVWTIQIAAVVGGHMIGAWGGHVVAARSSPAIDRSHRRREVPLAVIMVALTTLTLWSLGQKLVVDQPAGAPPAAAAPQGPGPAP